MNFSHKGIKTFSTLNYIGSIKLQLYTQSIKQYN